jgi:hypothetical protein
MSCSQSYSKKKRGHASAFGVLQSHVSSPQWRRRATSARPTRVSHSPSAHRGWEAHTRGVLPVLANGNTSPCNPRAAVVGGRNVGLRTACAQERTRDTPGRVLLWGISICRCKYQFLASINLRRVAPALVCARSFPKDEGAGAGRNLP